MKIVTVVGARPQFVKAAVFSREIRKHEGFEEILVHTGQHFDESMSEVFFNEMEIPTPKYNLEINSLGHGAMTGRMLEGIEEIITVLKTKTLYLKLKSFRIEKEVSQYVFWFDVKKSDINSFIKITENLKKEQENISIHVYSRTGIYE